MRQRAEARSGGETSWIERNSRRFAAAVMFGTGTLCTLALVGLFFVGALDSLRFAMVGLFFAVGRNDLRFDLAYFELIALATSAWSVIAFGPKVVRASNPMSAILLGITCVVLGIVTIAEGTLILQMLHSPAQFKWPDIPSAALGSAMLYPALGSVFSLFIPEIIGGLSGYLVWRIVRTRTIA